MDRLNQWLTLLANLGVLIGIGFVAYEVRQNTEATHAQTREAVLAAAQAELQAVSDEFRQFVNGQIENIPVSNGIYEEQTRWANQAGARHPFPAGHNNSAGMAGLDPGPAQADHLTSNFCESLRLL